MKEDRPNNLPFRTKDGLYMTWLPGDDAFENFVNIGIRWSKSYISDKDQKSDKNITIKNIYNYALIDTFFSDFISSHCVTDILGLCTKDSPFKVLLIDPSSPYAVARANAIDGGMPMNRAASGIRKLIDSVGDWALLKEKIDDKPNNEMENSSYHQLTLLLRNFIKEHGVPIDIKYYKAVPSGPRLFLRDILISGHYCVDRSSMRFPWLMMVDNPDTNQDGFSVFWDEFNRIWKLDGTTEEPQEINMGHSDIPKSEHKYFLSYKQKIDYEIADHIEMLLRRNGREVLRDESEINGGDRIDIVIDKMIDESDTLIAIWSKEYMESDYCKGEYETFSSKPNKRICFLKTDDSLKNEDLPMKQRGKLFADGIDRTQRENSIIELLANESK